MRCLGQTAQPGLTGLHQEDTTTGWQGGWPSQQTEVEGGHHHIDLKYTCASGGACPVPTLMLTLLATFPDGLIPTSKDLASGLDALSRHNLLQPLKCVLDIFPILGFFIIANAMSGLVLI